MTLWQRLSLLFAALLLACFGAAAWLQMAQSTRYSQQIEQQLLRSLAAHVAGEVRSMGDAGLDPARLADVVVRLGVTNPGVELYLLDAVGAVQMRQPQVGALLRRQVALAPLQRFLAGEASLILGDDPLSATGQKVFSAARYVGADGAPGYLYAVLQGSAYDMAAAAAGRGNAVEVALWSIGLVAPLGLVAGLLAFRLVTRPLAALTDEVERLDRQVSEVARGGDAGPARPAATVRDEIVILRAAFGRLAATNARQWQTLRQQDQQRREWVANISHDLRTPLASMQGYLETVLLQSEALTDGERAQFLRSALAQSQQLSRLAQELLELARLELGVIKPSLERFALVELAQDVLQKLALSAASRHQRLTPAFAAGGLDVMADIGMIERVMTNLLDNAIRHTPPGGEITLRLAAQGGQVHVEVADRGPGVPLALRPGLFSRDAPRPAGREGGGLGLLIVRQILQLHGSTIALQDGPGGGAVFTFALPLAP